MKLFARAERRPLFNFIENATLSYIDKMVFADESEIAEILSNKQLLAKLRLGSKEARERKKGSLLPRYRIFEMESLSSNIEEISKNANRGSPYETFSLDLFPIESFI